ncbi:hypothetical protein Tco_0995193, partial [Tanacetum coccineum]
MIGSLKCNKKSRRYEETTNQFDDVMKALASLTAKIQPENEKKNTGPQ